MWSEHSLEVIDAVARTGSFTAAAAELHRVPSAISYTVRQLEEWLAVNLFERRHRDVVLTDAGRVFSEEGRIVIKKMLATRRRCQQVANGWRGQLNIAVDRIVRPSRTRQLVVDFYRHFPDMELHIMPEVFNGVWDANQGNNGGYPPYNVELVAENHYRITIAVAGFAESELEITSHDNLLSVRGSHPDEQQERTWLYQGIAERNLSANSSWLSMYMYVMRGWRMVYCISIWNAWCLKPTSHDALKL